MALQEVSGRVTPEKTRLLCMALKTPYRAFSYFTADIRYKLFDLYLLIIVS